jgi:hypothetical protein
VPSLISLVLSAKVEIVFSAKNGSLLYPLKISLPAHQIVDVAPLLRVKNHYIWTTLIKPI